VAVRLVVELTCAAVGVVLTAWAILANQQWFDRHFLPAFFVSRERYVFYESVGRIAAAVIGLLLLFVARPRVGRFVARNTLLVCNAIGAVVLAFVVSEVVLAQLHAHAAAQEPSGQEPKRRLDPRLGWTFVPSRAATHLEN
jgi:hypothetical protein